MALVWCEVRCDQMMSFPECLEGDTGRWVRGTQDIKEYISDVKRAGWKLIDGELVCPKCAANSKAK